MKDQRLQVEVEGEQLVIRIGISTLAFAAEQCPRLSEMPGEYGPPYCKIVDQGELAKDICHELMREEEDGNTPLYDLLDECIFRAWEDGSIAFDEAFSPELPADR